MAAAEISHYFLVTVTPSCMVHGQGDRDRHRGRVSQVCVEHLRAYYDYSDHQSQSRDMMTLSPKPCHKLYLALSDLSYQLSYGHSECLVRKTSVKTLGLIKFCYLPASHNTNRRL